MNLVLLPMRMQVAAMLRGILLAIAAGTVAGTAFPVIILAIAILGSSASSGDLQSAIAIVVLAIAIPFGLVTSSAFLLGFPATAVLKKLGWESEAAYLSVGGVLGFLVPGGILAVTDGSPGVFLQAFPAGMLGALSGALTGRTWWRQYRAAIVEAEFQPAELAADDVR